jgi:hypothetical protein
VLPVLGSFGIGGSDGLLDERDCLSEASSGGRPVKKRVQRWLLMSGETIERDERRITRQGLQAAASCDGAFRT